MVVTATISVTLISWTLASNFWIEIYRMQSLSEIKILADRNVVWTFIMNVHIVSTTLHSNAADLYIFLISNISGGVQCLRLFRLHSCFQSFEECLLSIRGQSPRPIQKCLCQILHVGLIVSCSAWYTSAAWDVKCCWNGFDLRSRFF